MPHQVHTESNASGVVISFSGIVSGDEVVALNARLITEDSFSRCRYQVWDFSKTTRLDISTEDLRSISLQDIGASAINSSLKVAIVGEPRLFNNKDRIFAIFEEVWTNYRPRFFPDFETAREWASTEGS